ncbi:MAG: hypothetical protein ABIX01_17755 [Chitinophagaceae bacterium]
MKQVLLSIALVTVVCTAASAKIWRLNNNNGGAISPTIKTDFLQGVTLQQAHDSAKVLSGDTIHIEQSNTTYGNCTFTKRLTVIGVGNFLGMNPNTQVQTSFNSLVGAITITSPSAAGTQILGLQATYIIAGANNVKVAYCYFGYVEIGSGSAANTDNIQISDNYCNNGNTYYCISSSAGTGLNTNVGIYGNILLTSTSYQTINLNSNSSGIVKNNILYGYYTCFGALYNFYVVNNMSYNTGGAGYANNFYNCVIEYNMAPYASSYQTPGGTGNTTNATNNTLQTVANMLFAGGASTDGQWKLQPGSPAKNAGKSGVDLGAFAGDFPYSLSGIVNIPNIYQLNIATIPAGASTMSVTLSAKSN